MEKVVQVVQVVSSKSLPDLERFTFFRFSDISSLLSHISGSFSNIPERLSLTCFCACEKVAMVPHSLCNKLTVIFAIVGLSFEFILGTCIERDEQIQKYLTSSKPPFDNYFNISKAVYPSVDLPSLLINISVVFLETAGEKSNGSNSLSTLKRNVSRSTLHFTWSTSCLYVSGGEISLESMKWFSLGAIFPNRRKRELHITLPELCRDSPVDINKTMEYFLSTVNDHSELSNVFLSMCSFVV